MSYAATYWMMMVAGMALVAATTLYAAALSFANGLPALGIAFVLASLCVQSAFVQLIRERGEWLQPEPPPLSERDIVHEWEHPPGEYWRLSRAGDATHLECRLAEGDGHGDWVPVTWSWSPASLPEAVAYEILKLKGSR